MFLVILLCSVLFSIIYIYNLLKDVYKHWEKKGVPFVKPLYIFGNLKDVIFRKNAIFEIIKQIYQSNKNAKYIGCYQFLTPILLIRDPELIKQITIKDFKAFPDHSLSISRDVDPFFGNTLFMTSLKNGWDKSRAKIRHTLTSQRQRMMIPLMQECTQNLINFLKSKNGTVTLEMKDMFSKVCSDIIASVTLGVSVNSLEDENNLFFVSGKNITNMSGFRSLLFLGYANFPKLMKVLRLRVFPKTATDFFEHAIEDSLRYRKENNIHRPDFLQMLAEEKFGSSRKLEMSFREITSHIINFYLGGLESMSSTLAYSAYELAVNSDVQNKVYNEIAGTLQNSNGNLTYETISDMKYLDMVTSELLRLHTPNFTSDRKCVKPYIIKAKLPGETNLHIEQGTSIWLPLREIHLDPKNFPNPQKFNPERFNEENKAKMDPNSYIPFGSGPRHCVAERYALLKLKLILVEVMKHFEFVRVEKTEVPLTYRTDSFFVLPTNGLWIGIKPRT